MLGDQAPGLGQGLANYRHRQRRPLHDAERSTGQRPDPLRVQCAPIQTTNERANIHQLRVPLPLAFPYLLTAASTRESVKVLRLSSKAA